MAIEWDVYLGTTGSTGYISPFGRKVTINQIESIREARSSSGVLKKDIRYRKREFVLSYAYITEAALDTLDYWYEYYLTNKDPLPLYMYTSPSVYDEYEVIPSPVDRTRVVKADDNLFSGITFKLTEA